MVRARHLLMRPCWCRAISSSSTPLGKNRGRFAPEDRGDRHDGVGRRSFCALSPAVERRLERMKRRHDEIVEALHHGGGSGGAEAQSSPSRPSLGRELSRLSRASALHDRRRDLLREAASIAELIREAAEGGDDELAEEGERELAALSARQAGVERRIVDALLPSDGDDDEDDGGTGAVVEVRAGTGGDEASLFCAQLLESYVRTAAALRWRTEVLTQSSTDIGGVREAAISVTGRPSYRIVPEAGGLGSENAGEGADDDDDHDDDDSSSLLGPYGFFKFESGVHRVQRVPVNDSRIHTSACSVAVLPLEGDDGSASFAIPPSDLRVETMRSSGAGGQHVNTTDSAVRITHLPTGITASIQDERTQHKNKEKAMRLIAARVRDRQREERDRARGEARTALMGGGDRSERIRTYNYPQDRVTDHRCKTTRHGIESLLAGGAGDGLVAAFLPDLKALRREELLAKLEES
jgi:peptide chain release factor 1